MDHYRSSQQDQDSLGSLPVSLGTYHCNPPPPPPNPIRVSAFSKPSSSALNILSPKDQHHHHAPLVARNNGSSTASEFVTPITAAAAAAADHHPLQDPVPVISVSPCDSKFKYQECLRNHAASVGGHVLDGCCEFMPSNADPVKCAACDCHRSFHRKHTAEGNSSSRRDRISLPLLLPPPPTAQLYNQKQQQFASSAAFPPSPSGVVPGSSPMVAFGGNTSGSGATTESSSEERLGDGFRVAHHHHQQQQNIAVSKKRFRTKFTPEQKEKMLSFAERVGWRIQRQDDSTIDDFCREVGIRRQVFKVWMHNNKHSIRKQQQQQEYSQLQQIHQPPQAADPAAPLMTPTSPPSIFGHVRN